MKTVADRTREVKAFHPPGYPHFAARFGCPSYFWPWTSSWGTFLLRITGFYSWLIAGGVGKRQGVAAVSAGVASVTTESISIELCGVGPRKNAKMPSATNQTAITSTITVVTNRDHFSC